MNLFTALLTLAFVVSGMQQPVFAARKHSEKNHKKKNHQKTKKLHRNVDICRDLTVQGDTLIGAPYNVYWIGDSHSDSGTILYRKDIRKFIGLNLNFPLPNGARITERYNTHGISNDGKSRNFFVAEEAGLKLVNAYKIKSISNCENGLLVDFSISGASMTNNTRLSSLHPNCPPRFGINEEVDSFFDFLDTSNRDIKPQDVVWFSGLYNDIVFIGTVLAQFPNNLPPGTTPLDVINNAVSTQVDLIDQVYKRGARRVVVELWETIDDIESKFWQQVDVGFPGSVAAIQSFLDLMIANLKAELQLKLATDWLELDLYTSNISDHWKRILSDKNRYGVNPETLTTMIDQNPDTLPPTNALTLTRRTRELYHWDDTHVSEHTASIQGKWAAQILVKKPADQNVGDFGPYFPGCPPVAE